MDLLLEVQQVDPAVVWVDRYNALMERAFRVSKPVATSIARRIKEGATLDDLLLVLEWAVATWRGTQREQWLIPSTLLRPVKFPERLDLAKEWKRKRDAERERLALARVRATPTAPIASVPRDELAGFGLEMAKRLKGGQ